MGLTLVLFGVIHHPNSRDLRPFWSGFIELQKRLPSDKKVRQIVAHGLTTGFADLAHFVYAPQFESYEDFDRGYANQVVVSNNLEGKTLEGLDSNCKLNEEVLLDAHSRAKSIRLLEKVPIKGGQVLISNWNLGQETSDASVAPLVLDASLPQEYLYLPYSLDMDVGYNNSWMLAPWQVASQFGCFDAFVLDALAGRNGYLQSFSKTGWPRARTRSCSEIILLHPWVQKACKHVSKIIKSIQNRSKGNSFPQRALRRLTAPVQRFLDQPPALAENSCVPCSDQRLPVFPETQALNVQSLLKYFILSEGLRDKTRFLAVDDFELVNHSGLLINPQPIVLIVQDDDDEGVISRLQSESPMPLVAIYHLASGCVREYFLNKNGGWVTTTLQPASERARDLLDCALNATVIHSAGSLPMLLMPSADRYLGCSDWSYLNALAKYIAWSDLGYISLERSAFGRAILEFPDLYMVQDPSAFSLKMAAGTAEGVRKLVNAVDAEFIGFSETFNLLESEFPVVVRGKALF